MPNILLALVPVVVVQSLLGCRAFWGAEPSGVQGLVGCRALWGAEPCGVQSCVGCIAFGGGGVGGADGGEAIAHVRP